MAEQEILNFSDIRLLLRVSRRRFELEAVCASKVELAEVRLETEITGQPLLSTGSGPTRRSYHGSLGLLLFTVGASLPPAGGTVLLTLHVRHWKGELDDRAVALRYLGDGEFETITNVMHRPLLEAGEFPTPERVPTLRRQDNPQLASLLEQLDEGRIMADLNWLAADERNGRLTGSVEEREVAEYIKEKFEVAGLQPWQALGLDDFLHQFRVPRRAARRFNTAVTSDLTAHNVVGVLPGKQSDRYLLVSSHLDHLGRDSSGAIYNGADDDASGVVAMLNIAAAFQAAKVQPACTIVFVAFSGEEAGLLGSAAFSHLLQERKMIEQVVGDYNLEVLGARSGIMPTIWDEEDESTNELVAVALSAAEMLGLEAHRQNARDPGSDAYSLLAAGIPAISIDWDFSPTNHPYYHTVFDKAEYVNPPALTAATKFAATTIWLFASKLGHEHTI